MKGQHIYHGTRYISRAKESTAKKIFRQEEDCGKDDTEFKDGKNAGEAT